MEYANAEMASAADLRTWLEAEGAVDPEHVAEVTLRLPEFVALRDTLRGLFDASVSGASLPSSVVERLNDVSRRVPRVLRLGPVGSLQAPLAASRTTLALARIAWSAVELLGGRDRTRLRRCNGCGRYFLTTRPDRLWCSNACGNRIRVARHHARRREGAARP